MITYVKNTFLFFALLTAPVFMTAQETQSTPDYSETELDAFVEATQAVQQVQQGYQQKMMTAIEGEGLTAEEFQTMARAQQNPEADKPEMPEPKKEAFANAMNQVMAIQQSMATDMESALDEHEMAPEKYREMSVQIQKSPELSQKVMGMMQE